ncbi:MAG: SBBP repeat-containing protein [Planctomycetales bacterium]|nr:SBBP repeat-containing protein [Planctomycetales bacterium]
MNCTGILPLIACAALTLLSSLGLPHVATAQTLEWVRQEGADDLPWRGAGVFADGLGNVYVSGAIGHTGSENMDGYLAKYDAAGERQWSQQYDFIGRHDQFYDVRADHLGNVYAAGNGRASSPDIMHGDAIIAKFASDGSLLWERQLGTNNLFVESYRSVAVDGDGSVYAGGATTDQDGDALLTKYSADGDVVWAHQLGTDVYDTIYSIVTDVSGNLYAAGSTEGDWGAPNAGGADGFVSKFDSAGNIVWTRQIGTSETDRARGVAADALGNVFVTGDTRGDLAGANAGDYDSFLTRFDAEGNVVWTRQFGTDAFDRAWSVATDGLGNAFVAGWTRGGDFGGSDSSGDDAFLTMFSASGQQLWTRLLTTPVLDQNRAVATDGRGAVYISGYTDGSLAQPNAAEWDLFLAKYTVVPEPSAGVLLMLGGIAAAAFERRGRAGRYVHLGTISTAQSTPSATPCDQRSG